jgi:tetratricopeptide (TPR) repeat protein
VLAMRTLIHPALTLIIAIAGSLSLPAQSSSPPLPAISLPPNYDPRIRRPVPGPEWARPHYKNEQLPCFRWPMSPISSGMVSVTRLEVPEEAKKEFWKACDDVSGHKLHGAEQHLGRAVALYPKFAAAWVLLGQVQEDRGETAEAQRSCSQAREADSVYLAAYLCLAHLASRAENWNQVAEFTDQALALHPIRAPGAYYYNALAYLYLKQEPSAEKSALRVAEDPEIGKKAPIHLLLAKIYELKPDRTAEAEQLRRYLKLAPHGADSEMARQILQQIESLGTSSSSTTSGKLPAENKQ